MRKLALLLLFAAFVCAQDEEGAPGEEEARDGGLGALGGVLSKKPKPIDFAKVDRRIGRLPELKSPLYCLFLFGPDGETRVWAVLDGQVLYLDRNADGDLTGRDERIAANPKCGMFDIPDFREPGTDVVHTGFGMTVGRDSVSYHIRWAGETAITGACAFAPSPKDAPIFVPGTERPFDFAWAGETLKRGKENDVRVRIGSRGDRDAAFSWLMDEKFLPEGERVLVQIVCKDAAGAERNLTADLKERAPGGIYRGPVRIPKDAAKGPAIMRVRLPDSSAYESYVTDLPVTIE
jgi:hypothetical protein